MLKHHTRNFIIMKKTYGSFRIFTILMGILLLSSCTTEEVNSSKKNMVETSTNTSPSVKYHSSEIADAPKMYCTNLSDNLFVNANVNAPNINTASVLKAKKATFNTNKLCELFLGSENIMEKKLNSETLEYSLGEKKLIISSGLQFDFSTNLSNCINSLISFIDLTKMDELKKQEFSFLTKQKAIEETVRILKELNISPHLPPQIYALDYKTLQKERERLLREDESFKAFVEMGKVKLKDEWTEDDDCYYMIFQTEMYGIPCDPIGYTQQSSEFPVNGSEIGAIVSKNGFEACFVKGSVYVEEKSDQNIKSLISLEQALKSLNEKYNNIILSSKVTVTNISLIYAPVLTGITRNNQEEQIELVPTWLFETEQSYTKGNKKSIGKTIVRINAITGKEIL